MKSKHLVLVRHAKSSWADPGLADHDRPLNARGRDAAARVGERLRRDGPRPDLVLCSSAARTRQTLELLEVPKGTEVVVEDQLYGATASTWLARVRVVPTRCEAVWLIGHNPAIEDLACLLDRDGLTGVVKFPTAAVAVLRFDSGAWGEIGAGAGHLETFFTPRMLSPASD
jgi:phosphohistidine phosphatase